MLKDLFNVTPSEVHQWAFPPRKCNLTVYSACAQCLQHDQCQVNGEKLMFLLLQVDSVCEFLCSQQLSTVFEGYLNRETFDDYAFVLGCPDILQPCKRLRAMAQLVKYYIVTLDFPGHVLCIL